MKTRRPDRTSFCASLYGGANRTWVKYEDIPKNLIHACIAIEDKRFEDHQGVDWVTTLKPA